MVYREKNYRTPPTELVHQRWNELKGRLLTEMHSHEINPQCYRDSTIKVLITNFKNKCAICERSRGEELEVDHYRPKKRRDQLGSITYNQPGYYWLMYEWSNLIPLCSKCNRNKSNKFPLMIWTEDNRIDSHINSKNIIGFNPFDFEWLQQYEKPFLINPEHDVNPEKHFSFRLDGRIVGRTEEGSETINICKLNRNDLVRERLKIRSEYVLEINNAFDEYAINKEVLELKGALKSVFRRLKHKTHKDEDHSLYHTFLYRYFDHLLAPKLQKSISQKAIDYFEEFKTI